MHTKRALHSFSPFVFTWHGAQKGFDRFYAWPDALSHLKKSGFLSVFQFVFIYFQTPFEHYR
ncbi:hypothetical protein COL91_00065 [Bacillus pseudomycoides]|nr:hypothetical protein COO02_14905 [Bacillus pseudomycoides]PGA95270.1 hypothetical protein COL91_00065 [Bacillus pseudomycoides]PHF50238.1 hypothetical protein COF72_05110 [Bacillus pseudomycoides]